MVRIKVVNSMEEVDVVDKKTFETEINKLWQEVEKVKVISNPKVLKEYKKIGKESVKIENLKTSKKITPIEELLRE